MGTTTTFGAKTLQIIVLNCESLEALLQRLTDEQAKISKTHILCMTLPYVYVKVNINLPPATSNIMMDGRAGKEKDWNMMVFWLCVGTKKFKSDDGNRRGRKERKKEMKEKHVLRSCLQERGKREQSWRKLLKKIRNEQQHIIISCIHAYSTSS